MSSLFPFLDPLQVSSSRRVEVARVEQEIWPLLTEERRQKISQVAAFRCKSVSVVMEDIYDRGNVSAVIRSAEAFGFFQFHLIELREKMKSSNRVSQGAEKWIEIQRWKQSSTCVEELRSQGRRIYATSLSPRSLSFDEVDWSGPVALVLGNEKEGISPAMRELCDAEIVLPMRGFVQSFNISVAAALSFQRLSLLRDAGDAKGSAGDLNEEEQRILRAVYALRTLDSAEQILFRSTEG